MKNSDYRRELVYRGAPDEGIEPVYPVEEALLGGPVGKVAGKAFNIVKNRIGAFRTKNEIVKATGKSSLMSGRVPAKPENVTYAFRRTNSDEIDSIRKTGYALANPANKFAKNTKWWSEADESGAFGRNWNKGKEQIRTPVKNVKPSGAVGKKNLQRFNPKTSSWEGLKKGGTVKKIRKFDVGGMASSSPQPAFTQFGATPPAFGSGMAGGMANTADTGVGGVRAAPTPAMAQAPAMTPTAPTPAMRKGGAVKKLAKGGTVKKPMSVGMYKAITAEESKKDNYGKFPRAPLRFDADAGLKAASIAGTAIPVVRGIRMAGAAFKAANVGKRLKQAGEAFKKDPVKVAAEQAHIKKSAEIAVRNQKETAQKWFRDNPDLKQNGSASAPSSRRPENDAKYSKGGAVKKLAKGGKVLGDDETRLARFDQMTPAEQKKLIAETAAALKDAEGQRKRPLSSRILDKFRRSQQERWSIQEDIGQREFRYQDALKDAETLRSPRRHYGVDRVLKLDGKAIDNRAKGGAVKTFSKGGAVTSRGDGCCSKGKTKGRVC